MKNDEVLGNVEIPQSAEAKICLTGYNWTEKTGIYKYVISLTGEVIR